MNDKLIKKEYTKKIQLLNFYNKRYYDNNTSEINDSEYDSLKEEILELEKKYNFLTHKDSPSINVGYKASRNFKKVLHKTPMLSLGNAFSDNDLINFEKKILNYLNDNSLENIEYSAEPKIDGISTSQYIELVSSRFINREDFETSISSENSLFPITPSN